MLVKFCVAIDKEYVYDVLEEHKLQVCPLDEVVVNVFVEFPPELVNNTEQVDDPPIENILQLTLIFEPAKLLSCRDMVCPLQMQRLQSAVPPESKEADEGYE